MKDFESKGISEVDETQGGGYPGALPLDVEKYLPDLADDDISEAQKIEFLQTLWSIMSALVDLNWGVDSVNSFIPALRDFCMDSQGDKVETEEAECSPEFNGVAAAPGAERKEKDER